MKSDSTRTEMISERLKTLLKMKGMTFNELAEKLGITPNGLYLAFKRGKVTIMTLEQIAKVLNVEAFYFFEGDLTERLASAIAEYDKNPSLKDFVLGFTLDVARGLSLEEAVAKNLDKKGYKEGLLI